MKQICDTSVIEWYMCVIKWYKCVIKWYKCVMEWYKCVIHVCHSSVWFKYPIQVSDTSVRYNYAIHTWDASIYFKDIQISYFFQDHLGTIALIGISKKNRRFVAKVRKMCNEKNCLVNITAFFTFAGLFNNEKCCGPK